MSENRFFMSRDGVRIAYTEHGTGKPLVYVRGWLSHLDLLWDRPGFRVFIQTLSQHFRVIRYDMRGNGLSDRDGMKISLNALVRELEDLTDYLNLDSFVLWGATFGGPTAIVYAARHPERVEKLVLDGTYARGADITQRSRRFLVVLALRFFPEMGFLLLSNATHPNPQRSAQRTLELGTQMINPRIGSKLYRLAFRTDVQRHLTDIRMPTLVLHAQRSRSIPARLGQNLSAQIEDARFVALDSDEHNCWEGDLRALFEAISPFLGADLRTAPGSLALPAAAPQRQEIPDRPFVFVCYAHQDQEQVRRIVERIEATGLTVWIDAGISPGALWREQIAIAVQACSTFLLFASESSLKSSHCLREIDFAVDENRQVLVVYLDNAQLDPSLRLSLNTRQAIHKTQMNSERFEALLISGIQQLIALEKIS